MSKHRRQRPGRGQFTRRRDEARGRPGLLVMAVAALLLSAGCATVGFAALNQQHAPQPSAAQAGTIGPASPSPSALPSAPPSGGATHSAAPRHHRSTSSSGHVPALARSRPVSITIPAIDVQARMITVGLNSNGTIQTPPLLTDPSPAAWYKGSPTPGENGTSVIEGHVDSYKGPAVFFRLGDLKPGDTVDVTLADGIVAVFRITGVRQYPKDNFPTLTVYGDTSYPSLRLITCGGNFDYTTRHYLSNTVVFASLVSSHRQHQGH